MNILASLLIVQIALINLSTQTEWMYKFSPTKNINSQMSIECETNDQIWIGWAHYGTRNSTSSNQEFYLPAETDCWMNFTEKIAEQCNGSPQCDLSSQPTYIHKCGKISDYLYVTYKCVKETETFDICKPVRKTYKNSNDEFYIKSSEFPDEYSSNLDCSCLISTPNNLNLKLDFLWFSLQDNDYMTLSNKNLSGWINPTYEIPLSNKNNLIRFTTDDSLAYKGFWFKVTSRKTCKDDWQLVGDSCVKVFSEALDWRSANHKCTQMNGNLLKLDDVVSDLKLTQYMKSFYPEINSYWIGLRKYVDQHNQEKWMWSSNSTIYNDMSWWPWRRLNQPTDSDYSISNNCVQKRKNEDGYFTTSCDSLTKNSFICQTNAHATPIKDFEVQLQCGQTSTILSEMQKIEKLAKQKPIAQNSINNIILPRPILVNSNDEYAQTTTKSTTQKTTQKSTTQKPTNLFLINKNIQTNSIYEPSSSTAQSILIRQNERLNTTVLAGIISGIGLVIIIVNIVILFTCRRNLKKILKNSSKQSTGGDMIQEYFEAFNTLHNNKTLRGTLVQPKQQENILSIPKEESLFYPGQFNREVDLRQSAFKPFSKDLIQIQDVQRLLNQSQYDKMSHHHQPMMKQKNILIQNDSTGQYAHTYETLDTLDMPNKRNGHLAMTSRNYRTILNQTNESNLLQSPNSTDLSENTANFNLSTSTNLSSSSGGSSHNQFFKLPQNHQLVNLIQKNIVTYPCDNQVFNLVSNDGEWSPDSAYYSSIPNYASFSNQQPSLTNQQIQILLSNANSEMFAKTHLV
ncbi:unnamed protein product [Brachionus calyciflorus]|uniref:C-type lectin domain-containing protein n=1 Tax=Brachionus calyciflorus TaxID=104777 RepID=A0A813RG77_9BILA|nr:unnamed protein product [Brachionus calyciflorus]